MDTLNQDNKAGTVTPAKKKTYTAWNAAAACTMVGLMHLLDFPEFVKPRNAQRLRYSSLNDVHLVTFPSQPQVERNEPLIGAALSWFLDSSGAIGVRRDQPVNMTGRTSVQL